MNTLFQISLDTQLLNLNIDVINNGIDRGKAFILCRILKIANFSHILFEHGYLT